MTLKEKRNTFSLQIVFALLLVVKERNVMFWTVFVLILFKFFDSIFEVDSNGNS